MADATMDVVVKFIGDTKDLADQAQKVQGTGDKFKSWGKGIAGALAGAFAGKELLGMVSDAEAAQKATATLTQTLRNAGDSTGQWAKHAENLAGTLQNQTGVDDEIIKGGQAILATFHAVSGAAGQQAGVFDRATKAAVDMSAAGFGSVESASTMLGKALQDPLKGLTALGRAGVTFTKAQQDQIRALVASGQSLQAQNMILKEVENQVGGTAAASVTASEKMAASWGDTKEAIGSALIPVLNQLAPILADIAGFVQQNASWLVPLAAAIAGIVAVTKVWTIVQTALNIVMSANPLGLIALAIAGVVAAIVILIKNWDTVKRVAVAAWNTILGAVRAVWNWVKSNWPLLLAILTGPIGIAVGLIVKNWNHIRDALAAIIGAMRGLWDGFVGFVTGIPGRILAALGVVGGYIIRAFRSGIDGIHELLGNVVSWFAGLPSRIVGALAGAAGALYNVGRDWIASLARGVESAAGSVLDKAKSIASKAIGLLNPFGSPETVAFYTGQQVMADFARGVASRQTAVARSLGDVGARTVPALAAPATTPSRTYNLNVAVAPGSDPVQTGRVLVSYIQRYERANSAAWRGAS